MMILAFTQSYCMALEHGTQWFLSFLDLFRINPHQRLWERAARTICI